jgi:hypothetical protein
MDLEGGGGIALSDVIVWLAGEGWSAFSNDNGAGIRLLNALEKGNT